MTSPDAVRERLAREDADYRRLARKHEACEERLAELQGRRFLTDAERTEETTLKKTKLLYKDQMERAVARQLEVEKVGR
ncbi:MAG TPA: hypothetical protein VF139_19430 [Candidatus Polarisedimenticolaceae bacterium]